MTKVYRPFELLCPAPCRGKGLAGPMGVWVTELLFSASCQKCKKHLRAELTLELLKRVMRKASNLGGAVVSEARISE